MKRRLRVAKTENVVSVFIFGLSYFLFSKLFFHIRNNGVTPTGVMNKGIP